MTLGSVFDVKLMSDWLATACVPSVYLSCVSHVFIIYSMCCVVYRMCALRLDDVCQDVRTVLIGITCTDQPCNDQRLDGLGCQDVRSWS